MFFHSCKLVNRLVICAALCLMPAAASAQRTVSGQGMVSLDGAWPHGASLCYGQYLPSSFWEAGAFAQWRSTAVNDSYTMPYMPVGVFGNWMYRLVGTRSRVFNLYTGAGVFLGWEFYDPGNDLPDFVSEDLTGGTFLYGINAKIQAELFFTRTAAFLFTGTAPINFSSPCTWAQPCAAFGIRIDL